MNQMLMTRRFTGVCALLAIMRSLAPVSSAAADGERPMRIEVTARSLQPGELVMLTVTPPPGATTVRVSAFGRSTSAFELHDGIWRALVGIDIDQRPGTYQAAVEARAGSRTVRAAEPLTVKPKKFPTRVLKVEPDFVNPPPSVMSRIEQESAFLRETYARSAAARLWTTAFVRPVPGEANSRFGSRSVFNGEPRSPHSGADFLSGTGTPVKAPNAGRIVAARDLYFSGNTVIIDHGLGVFSMLAHLSRIDVHEGDDVPAAQVVGLVGATGRVTGPHLHWALRVSGARVDPLAALELLGADDHADRGSK